MLGEELIVDVQKSIG
jgi:hypothetical protein